MAENVIVDAIPLEMAVKLCAEIRAEAEKNWHTPAARWCWSCQQSSKGDSSQCGYLRAPGNRGCILINSRYSGISS